MQELDSYLNLGEEHTVLMKSYVGIEVEKENRNVLLSGERGACVVGVFGL